MWSVCVCVCICSVCVCEGEYGKLAPSEARLMTLSSFLANTTISVFVCVCVRAVCVCVGDLTRQALSVKWLSAAPRPADQEEGIIQAYIINLLYFTPYDTFTPSKHTLRARFQFPFILSKIKLHLCRQG